MTLRWFSVSGMFPNGGLSICTLVASFFIGVMAYFTSTSSGSFSFLIVSTNCLASLNFL